MIKEIKGILDRWKRDGRAENIIVIVKSNVLMLYFITYLNYSNAEKFKCISH